MAMKVYPPEFKADAVALYRSRPGATIAEIADSLGVNRETLHGRGLRRWASPRAARLAVFSWIARYNTRRRHSANGHLSPLVYEQRAASLELAA
ncbi:hypothetical protein GCM10009800_52970 [Nocardiopsis rhodophaea]